MINNTLIFAFVISVSLKGQSNLGNLPLAIHMKFINLQTMKTVMPAFVSMNNPLLNLLNIITAMRIQSRNMLIIHALMRSKYRHRPQHLIKCIPTLIALHKYQIMKQNTVMQITRK